MFRIAKCGVVVGCLVLLMPARHLVAGLAVSEVTHTVTLVAGQRWLSVSCHVYENGSSVQSVKADLPDSNGATSVDLIQDTTDPTLWTGSAPVVPVPGGVRWVSVTATDNAGQQTLAGAMIVVSELRFGISGDLVQGAPALSRCPGPRPRVTGPSSR